MDTFDSLAEVGPARCCLQKSLGPEQGRNIVVTPVGVVSYQRFVMYCQTGREAWTS